MKYVLPVLSLAGLALVACPAPEEDDPTATPETTPTQAPEVTPTEAPVVTPTEAPEVTPTQTPAITPTETPEVTPTQTPVATPTLPTTPFDAFVAGLEQPYVAEYEGNGDGGVTHVTWWGLSQTSDTFNALPAEEQNKVKKIQKTILNSAALTTTVEVPGGEVTGTLVAGAGGTRRQEVVLKVPTNWNGSVVIAGTPGVHTEFGNEKIMYWLLEEGYAFACGNKGMTNNFSSGDTALLSGTHPTQHWGTMMMDLATWVLDGFATSFQRPVEHVYLIGISNGGYQVRRALELDELRVQAGAERYFDGGVDWEGAFWPGVADMDQDSDLKVSTAEFNEANHLVRINEVAAMSMGWAYADDTLTKPANFVTTPPYTAAQGDMLAAGFSTESAVMWGAYNTLFDYLKAYYPQYEGVGYYNYTAWVYRAELLGHNSAQSGAYSPFMYVKGQTPALYGYLETAIDGNWTEEAVTWALQNTTTGVFGAPLVTIAGDSDGLLGVGANAYAYATAVSRDGDSALHRLYLVQHAGHVDTHADGTLDYDFDGTFGEEGMASQLTPLQPYAQRAFWYLTDWVEAGQQPPASTTVATDPAADVLDADLIEF